MLSTLRAGTIAARVDRVGADKRIRRGSFASVPELIAAIEAYLAGHNQNPRIFTWTATAERILAKVAKSKEVLGTLH